MSPKSALFVVLLVFGGITALSAKNVDQGKNAQERFTMEFTDQVTEGYYPTTEDPIDYVNCDTTGTSCKQSCAGLADGYYQFCGNCSNFLGCFDGVQYYGKCAGNLHWDDLNQICRENSPTCDECYVEPRCNSTGIPCITNCTGLPDNDYQLCTNCTSYATCTAEVMTVSHCDAGLYWDNYEPRGCSDRSHTCVECYDNMACESTGPSCIDDCTGQLDGRYQLCRNCYIYALCVDGDTILNVCSAETFWDDNMLGCFSTSDTCHHCAEPDKCDATGSSCIRRCNGQYDGYYQSCSNCTSYIQCIGGHTYYHECNPNYWYWDQEVRSCLPSSSTCTECQTENILGIHKCISTGSGCTSGCSGLEGQQIRQLCGTCTSYLHCDDGKQEIVECDEGLFYDDAAKLCVEKSQTCKECVI